MATVQDQENEHHRRFDHGSRGNEKAVSVTMALGGPQGCSNQRNDKVSGSECAEDCWRSRRLEALVSTGTAWEHVLQRGACRKWVEQRFELFSNGNAIIDLQIISEDEQLWLDAAAVVEDLLLSWAPLHSGLGHDAPVFKTTRRKTAQVQAYALPRCQLHEWHSGGQRQLEAWFQEQRATMPEQ